MRLSRHCYDKPHRCPGWAGAGMLYAKVQRCDNGHLDTGDDWWSWREQWRFHHCDTCDVVALPLVVRWLDWRWWTWWLRSRVWWKVRDWWKDMRR